MANARQTILQIAQRALSATLEPLEFTPHEALWIRHTREVTQVVAIQASRFGTAGRAAVWIEYCPLHGKVQVRQESTIESLINSENNIVRIRLNEISTEVPPYYMLTPGTGANSLEHEIQADIGRVLRPVLSETTDLNGIITFLADMNDRDDAERYALPIAVTYARLGMMEQGAVYFRRCRGDAEAIRRIARSYGIDLEDNP